MPRKSKATKLNEIHQIAVRRFEVIQAKESPDRSLAVEDTRFAHEYDGQWDEDAKLKRRDRPRLTINRVAPAIDQVVGDQRQNRTSIKVRPGDVLIRWWVISAKTVQASRLDQGMVKLLKIQL